MGRVGQIAVVILLAVSALVAEGCATTPGAAATSAVSAPSKAGSQPATVGSPEHLPELPPDAAGQGRLLTDYFKTHRLPLVGASVVDDKSGRQVILYGFVATPQGKTDAEDTATRIFRDPKLMVVNRIVVEPTLLASNKSGQGDDNSSVANVADAEVLDKLAARQNHPAPDEISQDEISQYEQQQQSSGWLGTVLVVLLLFLLP